MTLDCLRPLLMVMSCAGSLMPWVGCLRSCDGVGDPVHGMGEAVAGIGDRARQQLGAIVPRTSFGLYAAHRDRSRSVRDGFG